MMVRLEKMRQHVQARRAERKRKMLVLQQDCAKLNELQKNVLMSTSNEAADLN